LANQFLIPNQHFAGQRIQGKRDYQEDDFGLDNTQPQELLMVLADGMGGHQGGAHASSCAVQSFMDAYQLSSGNAAQRLKHALQHANQKIAAEVQIHPELQGMGCTLVGVVVTEEQIEWISVGDSPLWLYDNTGKLRRLNADHSMKPILKEQVRRGFLTAQEANWHPERNVLFSALTGNPIEMIDQPPVPTELFPGDCILLASDGLFTLSDTEIAHCLQKNNPALETVNELLEAIKDKGLWNQDNTTALFVKIPKELPNSKKKPKILISNLLLFTLLGILFWSHSPLQEWLTPKPILLEKTPEENTLFTHKFPTNSKNIFSAPTDFLLPIPLLFELGLHNTFQTIPLNLPTFIQPGNPCYFSTPVHIPYRPNHCLPSPIPYKPTGIYYE